MRAGARCRAWQAAHAFGERPYEVLTIGLAVSAAELDARIDARLEAMLAAGFVDEVRALCASGLADDAPAWNAVGYRELREVVRGQATLDDAVRATRRATRQFAKRQRTWFRRDATVALGDARRRRRRGARPRDRVRRVSWVAEGQGPG